MSDSGHGKPGEKPSAGGYGHGGDELPKVDVSERGGKGPDGEHLKMDRRLFVELMVFDCADDANPHDVALSLASALEKRGANTVIYEDASAPRGIGVAAYDENPAAFVDKVRPAINSIPKLSLRREFTMMGRSYASGHETDLQFWLFDRPRSVLENEAWNWAVWYPLRRNGAFARLEPREQAAILREHAIIGRAYGAEDLAHDVRLACHGLDTHDNEFVIGLIGKDLHPLSHVVQAMRKTRQTSEFIDKMGPFFVGRAVHRTKAV